MTAAPRFTIVTPVLNRVDMIAAALDSVRAQDCAPIEHIVVDGGSTDGTLDVVRRYPEVRLLHGPDRGLYDAINKGLEIATGEAIGLLNSDDVLCPGALIALDAALRDHPEADAACGGVAVRDGGGALVAAYDDEATKRLDFRIAMRGVPITNGRFFRRRWFSRAGGFDIRYKIAADRDFLIRSLLYGMVTVPVQARVYEYRAHEGSLTISVSDRQGRRTRDEYLELARSWLAAPHGTPALRQAAAEWLAVETAWKALHHLREGQASLAGSTVLSAFAADRLWPLRLGVATGRRLLRREA